MKSFSDLSLIDAVVLFGVAVVLPMALGGARRWWAVSAAGALAALLTFRPVAGAAR